MVKVKQKNQQKNGPPGKEPDCLLRCVLVGLV